MNKEKFYIFLDIDGVLYDWKWLKENIELGNIKSGGIIKDFNPESIKALNYLYTTLSKGYEVEFVVTSAWKRQLDKLTDNLVKSGFIYEKKLKIAPNLEIFNRGEEVLAFLSHEKPTNNYLIIDDESFDYDKYFSKDRIIKTDMADHSLNMQDVEDFIDSLEDQNSI